MLGYLQGNKGASNWHQEIDKLLYLIRGDLVIRFAIAVAAFVSV
jgi:hypothetical protein